MRICKFYLNRNTIYAYINIIPKRENRIRINTNISIDQSFWDKTKCRAKHQFMESNSINIELDRFEKSVCKSHELLVQKYHELKTQKADKIKNEFLSLFEKVYTKKSVNNFFDVFDEFIESKQNSVSNKTYLRKISIKNFLLDYQQHSGYEITFENINENFKSKFEKYLTDRNYSDNYIAKIFSITREFMLYAFRNKYHSSLDYKLLTKSSNRVDIVVLTEQEKKSILNADLGPNSLNRARDLFILQLEMVQRYSDIFELSKQSFYYDSAGDLFCKIRQQKTNQLVNIPLSPIATQIVLKYNFEIPKLSNQKINVHIKDICRIAGIDEAVAITKYKAGKKIIESKPKFELITSHTARRTGATLLVEKGIPIPFVMELTGHKTLSEFQKYIGKTSNQQLKTALKKIWYSNNLSLAGAL